MAATIGGVHLYFNGHLSTPLAKTTFSAATFMLGAISYKMFNNVADNCYKAEFAYKQEKNKEQKEILPALLSELEETIGNFKAKNNQIIDSFGSFASNEELLNQKSTPLQVRTAIRNAKDLKQLIKTEEENIPKKKDLPSFWRTPGFKGASLFGLIGAFPWMPSLTYALSKTPHLIKQA